MRRNGKSVMATCMATTEKGHWRDHSDSLWPISYEDAGCAVAEAYEALTRRIDQSAALQISAR